MKHQMRYKILLIFGIFSNFFVSCDEGEVDKIFIENYSYINTTEHLIRIQEWKNGNLTEHSILTKDILLNSITLGMESKCSINGNVSDNSDCLLIYSDSIRVIFNNLRFLEYKRNTNSNLNILKTDNYITDKINNVTNYKYNFTELDFNNSEPCNGNCE